MKGSIFLLFEEFVVESYGEELFEELLASTELETVEPFVAPGTYPATDLVALLMTASAKSGLSTDELLHRFGVFAFPALARSAGPLLDGIDSPQVLLQSLEAVVHTEIRKLDPEANPARFEVVDLGPDELELHYVSPLGLFSLVEGLLDGIAAWFDQPVVHQRVSTDGTNAVFRISFSAEATSSPERELAVSPTDS